MKKTAHRKKAKRDHNYKIHIRKSPVTFWNYINTINSAVFPYLDPNMLMVPFNPLQYFPFKFSEKPAASYIQITRRKLIDSIPTGSMLAFVFCSRHRQLFPIYKQKIENVSMKVRTFFGHFIQQRNKESASSILLRVFIAGEFFLFRIFLYAPNILTFFTLFKYKGRRRSSFMFKVRSSKYSQLQSRKKGH